MENLIKARKSTLKGSTSKDLDAGHMNIYIHLAFAKALADGVVFKNCWNLSNRGQF